MASFSHYRNGASCAVARAAADHVATLGEHVFIAGKFYSIFSLLFGIGFGVQLARGGDAITEWVRSCRTSPCGAPIRGSRPTP